MADFESKSGQKNKEISIRHRMHRKVILKGPGGVSFSWERFFTAFLIQKTRDSYLRYAKEELNSSYLNEKISERILDVIERIRVRLREEDLCESSGLMTGPFGISG